MHDTTERPEGVEAGTVKLVGADSKAIIENVNLLIENKDAYKKMAQAKNPYGDGKAATRIAAAVFSFLASKSQSKQIAIEHGGKSHSWYPPAIK